MSTHINNQKKIICYGFHAVHAILADNNSSLAGTTLLVVPNRRNDVLMQMAKSRHVWIEKVDHGALITHAGAGAKQAALVAPIRRSRKVASPQGTSKPISDLKRSIAQITADTALAILLDGVTNVGNAGAILRTAELFQADLMVLPRRRTAGEDALMSYTSTGGNVSLEPTRVPNIDTAIRTLRDNGFWIIGGDVSGQPLAHTDLTGRIALIVGDEHRGLSHLARTRCDTIVSIPTGGNVQSFNVSIAAAILMYEVRRQQNWENQSSQ